MNKETVDFACYAMMDDKSFNRISFPAKEVLDGCFFVGRRNFGSGSEHRKENALTDAETPINLFRKECSSFVYCFSAWFSQENAEAGFVLQGYRPVKQREVNPASLLPSKARNIRFGSSFFIVWTLYKREAGLDDTFGPSYLSTLVMNEDILGNYMVLFDMNGYAPRWISLESSPADWTLNELMDIHAQGGHPAQEEKRFAERNANLLKDYLKHHPDTILYYVDDVDIRNSKEYQDSPLPGYFSNLVKEMELADKHKLYVFSHNSVPEKKNRIKDSMKTQSSVFQQDKANPADIAKGQSELKRICKPDSALRRMAIEQELLKRGRGFATLDDGTLVVPANTSEKANTIALCAHYDVVPGSLGYNDNGMSVVILLNMLDKLPENAEVVFTNGEETGMTGARNYLGKVNAHPRACINLDVCGCFDQVYLDPMNCPEARTLSNCKCGDMPPNDGYVFEAQGVPSVCFSTGPADVPFHAGIQAICSTLHNGPRDNDFELLNFSMIPKVQDEILKLLALLGDRAA